MLQNKLKYTNYIYIYLLLVDVSQLKQDTLFIYLHNKNQIKQFVVKWASLL